MLGSLADRVLSFEGWIELGGFFTGTRQDYVLDLTWRPTPWLNVGFGYEYHDIEVQAGRFIVRTGRLAWNINLTRHLIVNLLAQFDNVTESLGINARLRWTLAPGRDIFLVFNQGVDLRDDAFRPTRSELIAKVSWNFLF